MEPLPNFNDINVIAKLAGIIKPHPMPDTLEDKDRGSYDKDGNFYTGGLINNKKENNMPSGVYPRKNYQSTKAFRNKISKAMKESYKRRMNGGGLTQKYDLVIANMDTIERILELVNTIKSNKIGRIK